MKYENQLKILIPDGRKYKTIIDAKLVNLPKNIIVQKETKFVNETADIKVIKM